MEVSTDSSDALQVSWACADLQCVLMDRDSAQLLIPYLCQFTDFWKLFERGETINIRAALNIMVASF